MTQVNNYVPASLTSNDISRMPTNAMAYNTPTIKEYDYDTYSSNEKTNSGFKKTILTLAIIAGGIVGLKYCGKNSFLKFDSNSDKLLDKIKKGIISTSDMIEKPFVWCYQKLAGLFNKK